MKTKMRMSLLAAAILVTTPIGAVAEGYWDHGAVSVLPSQSVAAAAAFHRYMQEAATLDGRFADGKAVAEGVKRGAAYDPVQMQEGMVLYAAYVALRNEQFVASVRDLEARLGRSGALQALSSDPAVAITLPGADEAAGEVAAALKAEGEALRASGQSVKQAAYDLQHQPWSLAFVPNPQTRLAEAKALGTAARPSEDDAPRLAVISAAYGRERNGGTAHPTAGAVPRRGLALAALLALGEPMDGAQAKGLLKEARSATCLRMAKLNFHQCLSVAGPQYEDVYCLGQHALIDTGQCVAAAAAGG